MDGALARLAGGDGGALLVSGEPGIGKSRLLDEGARRAAASGMQLFEGKAAELERDFPFGVFVDAFDPYLASLDGAGLRALSTEQRRLLTLVFPALAGGEREGAIVAQERFLCYRAVAELLAVLAARRPLVLILDDLQWADAASLELLEHLLRRMPDAVLMLLAHRARSSGALLPVSDRLELEPLTREDAQALLHKQLDPVAVARVYHDSGGNPFYLEHLALAERSNGRGPGVGVGGESLDLEVPAAVRDALARELAELGEETRRVLHGAAVAGDPFTPELAAEIAEEALPAALAALDRAIAVGLVTGTETPVLFRFRHPIIRHAMYASAGDGWRVGAHARAAALLARRGAGALDRAHHIERSAVPGDDEAVRILTAAGQMAAQVAPASAARWFAAALRLLPAQSSDERRLGLLAALVAALGSAGRLHDCRATLLEILDTLPSGDTGARIPVIAFTAVIDRLLGRGDARRMLEQTLADVKDRDSSDATALELELAADRNFPGDWVAMREHAERGWAAAGRAGDAGLRALGAALLGIAEYMVGEMDTARERHAEASALVDAPAADRPGLPLDAVDWLGWLEMSLEKYDAAVGHFTRGLELARASGGGHLLTPLTFGLVLGSTWSGRLDDALEHSDASLELARLLGSDRVFSWALGLRTLLQLRRGNLNDAVALGEQARRLGQGLPANTFFAVIGGWYGEALIEAGQPVKGRAEILRALGGPGLPDVESGYRPYFYDVLAAAEVALGRRDAAAEWARAAEETAHGLGLSGRTGAALHAAALAAQTPELGARQALAAAATLAACQPIEGARARILAARHLAAAGDRDGALTELRRATTDLTALGATHYAAQAIRERRRLGERLARGGRRATAVTGTASLSDREHQVARLVIDRLTNREIAERLALSEKTIERHLSRIFVKLQARSRVEVARTLESATPSH